MSVYTNVVEQETTQHSIEGTVATESPSEEENQANEIAATLIGFLVAGFKQKENRDPTQEEIEDLMAELTEERINEMLGGVLSTSEPPADAEEVTGAEDSIINTNDGEEVAANGITDEEENVQENAVQVEKEEQIKGNSSAEKLQNAATFAFSWPADENAIAGVKRNNEQVAQEVDGDTISSNTEQATKKQSSNLTFSWPAESPSTL